MFANIKRVRETKGSLFTLDGFRGVLYSVYEFYEKWIYFRENLLVPWNRLAQIFLQCVSGYTSTKFILQINCETEKPQNQSTQFKRIMFIMCIILFLNLYNTEETIK